MVSIRKENLKKKSVYGIFRLFAPVIVLLSSFSSYAQAPGYVLIAHRGGVVDSSKAENSLPALQAAIERGYQMVEVDLRITKDGVPIIHHDANFNRYYGVNKAVTSMTWEEISRLKSDLGGSGVLRFEEVLQYCEGKIGLMIDNKIDGNDTTLFASIIAMMKKYRMYDNALMIGTDESTAYFTGKIKLSCTRKQLEENIEKPGFDPSYYYLFSDNITKEDADWAKSHHILAVGVVNAWRYRRSPDPERAAQKDIQQLKAAGITHFQIDSQFDHYFLSSMQKQ
jgi:glycerophosphoryl diester phosphodiesterase